MNVRPALVPELICSDVAQSRAFYCDVLGFSVVYERSEDRFLYLERDGAEIMLEQPHSRDRLFPEAEFAHPYGRGINFEITVGDVTAVHAAVLAADLPIVLPLEERWYGRATDAVRVRQFALHDPDGYLLRFSETIDAV
jgi:lactoylglutathione lyase